MIPRPETQRLLLRGRRAEDFETCPGFMADPEVTGCLSGKPMSRADAWRNMAKQRMADRPGEACGERREIEYRGSLTAVDVWSISREEWVGKA